MKAVMPIVPPEILALRRRTGADRLDEMWEGVLHMAAAPTFRHQDLEGSFEVWLRTVWAPTCQGKVVHNVNVASVGGWPQDYRIPDLVLLTPERFHINRDDFLEGGPDVAVEIRSPGDEAYEKIDFYLEVGTKEVWIVDRDTKRPQMFVLADSGKRELAADDDGWLRSPATGVEMRAENGKLLVRLAGDQTTSATLP